MRRAGSKTHCSFSNSSLNCFVHRCKVFEFYDYEDGKNKCFQTPAIDESVTGTLAALPGCNPIVSFRLTLVALVRLTISSLLECWT